MSARYWLGLNRVNPKKEAEKEQEQEQENDSLDLLITSFSLRERVRQQT